MDNVLLSLQQAGLSTQQDPTFPLEIFEHILQYVALTTRRNGRLVYHKFDIKNCCLVCKDWVSLCRAHLFGIVELGGTTSLRGRSQTAQAIYIQPKIAQYVKTISYTIDPHFSGTYILNRVVNPCVASLLNLPNVKHFQVSADPSVTVTSTRDYNQQPMAPFGFRRFMDAYIPSPSLTELTVTNLHNIPINNIIFCPNLKFLNLNRCTLQNQPFESSSIIMVSNITSLIMDDITNVRYSLFSCLPYLQKLRIGIIKWDPAFEDPQCDFALRLNSVTSLELMTGARNSPWLSYIMERAESAGSKVLSMLTDLSLLSDEADEDYAIIRILGHVGALDSLEVKATENSETFDHIRLDTSFFENHPTLKELHLAWTVKDGGPRSTISVVKALSHYLSQITSPASLKTLSLRVEVPSSYILTIPYGLAGQLEALDTTLFVNLSMFPCLRHIFVNISIQCGGAYSNTPHITDVMWDDLKANLKASFRRTTARVFVDASLVGNLYDGEFWPDNLDSFGSF